LTTFSGTAKVSSIGIKVILRDSLQDTIKSQVSQNRVEITRYFKEYEFLPKISMFNLKGSLLNLRIDKVSINQATAVPVSKLPNFTIIYDKSQKLDIKIQRQNYDVIIDNLIFFQKTIIGITKHLSIFEIKCEELSRQQEVYT
jgi:hypothetical protein